MDKISITGGHTLRGDILVSGAKNAALPLMTAAILTEQPLLLDRLHNHRFRDAADRNAVLDDGELGYAVLLEDLERP